MTDTFTSLDRFIQMGVGGDNNAWGTNLNTLFSLIEQLHDGVNSLDVTAGGTITATTNNNATDQARMGIQLLTGSPAATVTYKMPPTTWVRWFINATGQNILVLTTAGGSTGITLAAGNAMPLVCKDSTNVTELISQMNTLTLNGGTISNVTLNSCTISGGTF